MTIIDYTVRWTEAAILSETDAETIAEALTAKRHTNVEAAPSGLGNGWIVQQTLSNGTRRAVTREYADSILSSRVV